MRNTPGHTLLELVLVLALLGILTGMAMPGMARWRDGMAVRSAREEVAAALAWTRLAATAHGGATLHLDPATTTLWTSYDDGGATPPVDLAGLYGVRLDVGSDAEVTLRYDQLGIGRVANRTVRLRRGRAVAGVTVSAYGRFRRW